MKELAQLIEKSQKLYPMQERAIKLFLNKDFNASKLLYEQIIQINPDDNVAKRKVEDIRAMISTPPNNDLDKYLEKGDDFLAKGELEKAKSYYRIISGAIEEYPQKSYASAKIEQVKELQFQSEKAKESITINPSRAKQIYQNLITKFGQSPYISNLINELEINRKTFNSLVSQGKKQFEQGNYLEAEKLFKKARKIEGYDKKLNVEIANCRNILLKKDEILGWRSDPSKEKFIEDNYNYIFNKNKEDPIAKKEYYDRFKEKFSTVADCDKIIALGNKLYSINKGRADSDGVKSKIDECDKTILCKKKRENIYSKYKELNATYNRSSTLTDFRNLSENLLIAQKECNKLTCLADSESICNDIKIRIETIDQKIKTIECFNKASAKLYLADSVFLENDCENAIKYYTILDSNCLSLERNAYVSKQKVRSKVCFENQQYEMYLDSASKAKKRSLFRDEIRLYNAAKTFANDSVKRVKIEVLIAEYNCVHFPADCKKIIDIKNPCSDTTKKIMSLELLGGVSSDNSQVNINLSNSLMMNSKIGYNFGLRFQKANYTKIVGYRIGFVGSYQQFTIPFQLIDNFFFNNKFDLTTIDLSGDIKFHTKNRCANRGRYYSSIGFVLGKSFVSGSTLQNQYSTEIINSLEFLHGGISIAFGYEVHNKNKSRTMLEIFYQRKGNVVDKFSKISNPLNSSFYGGLFGIKVGYLLTIKAQ